MEKISGLALGLHPINIKSRPRQLGPFNDQLADVREPLPPYSGRNSLTDHKKSSDLPLQLSAMIVYSGIR